MTRHATLRHVTLSYQISLSLISRQFLFQLCNFVTLLLFTLHTQVKTLTQYLVLVLQFQHPWLRFLLGTLRSLLQLRLQLFYFSAQCLVLLLQIHVDLLQLAICLSLPFAAALGRHSVADTYNGLFLFIITHVAQIQLLQFASYVCTVVERLFLIFANACSFLAERDVGGV